MLSSQLNAPMGMSVPAAIGAALSCGSKQTVVAIATHQSLLMTGLELTTAMAMK